MIFFWLNWIPYFTGSLHMVFFNDHTGNQTKNAVIDRTGLDMKDEMTVLRPLLSLH